MTTNKKRLLLPQSLAAQAWDLLQQRADIEAVGFPPAATASELNALLTQHAPIHGIALGVTKFGDNELDLAPDLKVVARIGVGFDEVDVAALTRRNIPLMTTDIANSPSVAEAALFMMLALAKRSVELDALVRNGQWNQRIAFAPFDLFGKTVVIVGFGRIGTRMAARCRAMEMTVLVFDPYQDAAMITAAGCEVITDLDAALPRADFLTLHCPRTPETTDLIDAAQLSKMKPGAYLINTARGGIVNEAALYTALKSGVIAGAGIDVFVQEPTPVDNPLLSLANVIVAPHLAGVTREALERMGVQAVRNILSVLDGAPSAVHVVNKEVLVNKDALTA